MQYFQDPNGKAYAFDDDVVAVNDNGAYSFKTAAGQPLSALPEDLAPCPNNTPPGPTLARARSTQTVTIKAACAVAIAASFTSSALGAARTYGAQPTDQANIAAATAGGGSLWCADGTGTWALVVHTEAQAQQVRSDLWAHVQTCQTKYADLLNKISTAGTVSGVQKIAWS